MELLRTSRDYGFETTAYCFMPDHLHVLVEGRREDASLQRFTAMFKQRSAFEHVKQRGGRVWQEGYFDHVVREGDDILGIAAYILANPLRAGLCSQFAEYPYLGSGKYTVEQLREALQTRPTWTP